jgi:hypothetical protein
LVIGNIDLRNLKDFVNLSLSVLTKKDMGVQIDEKIGYQRYGVGIASTDIASTQPNTTNSVAYPTPEEIFEIWRTYFEPLLLSSDNHDAALLEEFESDIFKYVTTKISIV